MQESELERERAVVAALYERLDELRAETEDRLDRVRRESVGSNHQARSERDAFARLYEDQLMQLRDVDSRLVFGRLLLEEPADDGSAHRYIGRVGLRDDDQRSLLVDWRAQQASAFYQATASERMGVRARRHLTMTRPRGQPHRRRGLRRGAARRRPRRAGEVVQGEGALLAALTAQRTGRMHDIVATIQAEQDRIIRSDLRGALVVQGGPGTGKTAVALHRAAYLLYANRQRLSSSGVLVVGPSTAFLRYIEAVLPSLGETGVVMSTLGELYPGVEAVGDDEPEAARPEGLGADGAAAVARRALPPEGAGRGADRRRSTGERLVVEPELIARAIAQAQRSGKPHNVARVTFVKQRARASSPTKLAAQLRASGSTIDDADLEGAPRGPPHLVRRAGAAQHRVAAAHAARSCSRTSTRGPSWLAELTPRWTAAQRAALAARALRAVHVSDVPLLDEAAELLGAFPGKPDAGARERDRQRKRDLENARAAIRNMGVEGLVSAEQLADGFAEQRRPRHDRRARGRRPHAGRTGTSWSTRRRSSRRCSGACWCGAAR